MSTIRLTSGVIRSGVPETCFKTVKHAAWLGILGLSLAVTAPSSAAQTVALKAGTIHLVEGGKVVHDGTILVRDGKIVAVGNAVAIPRGTRVFDYGAGAVIVPGLVSAFTSYGFGGDRFGAPDRTAAPEVRAIDGFDFYGKHMSALTGGVTTVYLAPPEGRLLAGQAAVVKLGDGKSADRVLDASVALHGAIDQTARGTPGYWEPPLPATVDTGMDWRRPQLPKTTMGAIVALEELLELASGGAGQGSYGPYAGPALSALMKSGTTWRIAARESSEILALLDFATKHSLPLVVDGADQAGEVASELAKAGASVVYRVPFYPNVGVRDLGRSVDASWNSYDVPAALIAAGVPVAIASSTPHDLLFAAGLASRGGLSAEAALRAITLTPAEILGVADRVGSLKPGKDADFAILNGEPISGRAGVLATWVGGKTAWDAAASGPSARADATPAGMGSVVLSVDELYLGDGRVLRPGEVAIQDGKITEVGETVARPKGATVVRGRAAMPGIVDALGYLGLERSRKVPGTDFRLGSIVSPGDRVDRRVALAGVTTVVLAPRKPSNSGAPMMAYKPAATSFADQVIGDPVALRMAWSDSNRLKAGAAVTALLGKATAYQAKWLEYEEKLAAWTPPALKASKNGEEEEEAGKDDEDDDEDEKKDEKKDEKDDDKKKKKKKKKKKGEEELEPDPVTGVWEANLDTEKLRLRLHLVAGKGSGAVEGNLRSDVISESLVELEGAWDRDGKSLRASGLGSAGWVKLEAALDEGKFLGKVLVGEAEHEFTLERVSKEWIVAKRSERRADKTKAPKPPKGTPKRPKRDRKLEPVVAILRGEVTLILHVSRSDEILACVAACESFGVKPVLFGAEDAWMIADQIAGRVKGILPGRTIVESDAKLGTDVRTPYSDLRGAGIPIAFYSGAEEGAAELSVIAAYAIANGLSPAGGLRALTFDAANLLSIGDRVGLLAPGYDGDVLLLNGAPLAPGTSVQRTWVNGNEVVAE